MSRNQSGQHFLLSKEARTLSLSRVMRLSDDEAFDVFKAIRWADNGGEPYCPKCGCTAIYAFTARRIFKCMACNSQFSVTSGTIFASRKMAIRDILAAIAIFTNGAKGHSALQLGRDLDCQYKTAFVLAHKIRESIAAEQTAIGEVAGSVEVDGAYFGGYLKPANRREDRKDRRRRIYQTGKREVVVVRRERGGRTLPFVAPTEAAGVAVVASTVAKGSTIYADEAAHWNALEARFLTKRINHMVEYAAAEANTNQAESFFSRIRRVTHPPRRDRHSPSHRRSVPPGVRRRNGLARGQPPGFQRRVIPRHDRRRTQSPGVSSVEGLLAAGGGGGSLGSESQPSSTTLRIPSSMKRRPIADTLPPKNSARASASKRSRVKVDTMIGSSFGFLATVAWAITGLLRGDYPVNTLL